MGNGKILQGKTVEQLETALKLSIESGVRGRKNKNDPIPIKGKKRA